MRKPNLDMQIFKKRRELLAQKTQGSAVIIPAHPEMLRNNDVHHPYRQDSSLFYFTGFEEPESVLVFRPGLNPEYVLFVRPKDVLRETWDGFRYGQEGAQQAFGVDKTFLITDIATVLPDLLKPVDRVYYKLFENHEFDRVFTEALAKVRLSQGRSNLGLLPIMDSSEIIGEMRLKKAPEEIAWLRKACEITSRGHLAGMKFTRPGVNELQLSGTIEHSFRMLGSPRNGYHPIVASGPSATTLHYNFNDQECKDGDLVLVDMGAEYNYFTGDITRTYPVNGKFTPVQKRFYQVVLNVQKEILNLVKPGLLFKDLQETAISLLTTGLLELGILRGPKELIIEQARFKKYYPHGVSHWLGMDVHDAGLYKVGGLSRPIEEGMCFTIEPGLYVPLDDTEAPKEYRGLGVRIEDNILVTANGCENMTSLAPKEVSEIEALVGTA